MKFQGMTIGVPKEIMHGERRVSATPDTVKKMVADGATVLVEKGAGDSAFFADSAMLRPGARSRGRSGNLYLGSRYPEGDSASVRGQ